MKFKAIVYVSLRAAVDDSAGNAVRAACGRLSDLNISKLRLGKAIDMRFEAPSYEHALSELEKLSSKFLANTVIEDWSFELEEDE